MKRIPKIAVFISLFVSVAFAQEFTQVRAGLDYAAMTREIDGVKVQMNLLRIDLKRFRLDVVHGLDTAIGVEKTSSMAKRHGALAAINAGFFRLDSSNFNGDDVGTLMIDGELWSESYAERTTVGFVNKTALTSVTFQRERIIPVYTLESRVAEANGINRERKADETIVYTSAFGRTTLTEPAGVEVTVQDGKVVQIADGRGSNLIPSRGYVISATGRAADELRAAAKIGQRSGLNTKTSDSDKGSKAGTREREDLVAGVPRLIRDGKIDITWQEEKSSESFVTTKHPRTAVALLNNGLFLMVTVDGRSEASGGISLPKLAELLLELGAKDAMNLDGGGSTTMCLDGKVVNKPSDKEGERRVSSAILVSPR